MNGLVSGDSFQQFMKHAFITDLTHNIEAEIHYNPWQDNTYSGMLKGALKWGIGKAKGKKETKLGERIKRNDDVHVKIYQKSPNDTKKEKIELASGEGCWMSYLMIDGKTFWRVEDTIPQWKERGEDKRMTDGTIILPSDSDWRPDIMPMVLTNWKEAEHQKVAMEEL